jgi:hypothetical protein
LRQDRECDLRHLGRGLGGRPFRAMK